MLNVMNDRMGKKMMIPGHGYDDTGMMMMTTMRNEKRKIYFLQDMYMM